MADRCSTCYNARWMYVPGVRFAKGHDHARALPVAYFDATHPLLIAVAVKAKVLEPCGKCNPDGLHPAAFKERR